MIDNEREQLRKTYQLCRMGFFFLALALIPVCVTSLVGIIGLLCDRRAFQLLSDEVDQWVFTISVWGNLIGTMLLWGRWEHRGWQRRSGFLLLLCLVDVGLWFLRYRDGNDLVRHWFRNHLGEALGWAEFALLASLSGDFLVHLGIEPAEDSARSTRSLAATGAVVWMLQFCEVTNWRGGWPLRPRPVGVEGLLLHVGTTLIWTITLLQVTALVIASFRHSNRVLREMEQEDREHDVLGFPSESSHDDLLHAAR
jgi:hypothetical protein